MKYHWLRDVNWKRGLRGDLREIAEACGIETLIVLMQNFEHLQVGFNPTHLRPLLRQYVREHPEISCRQLARVFGVSERFAQKLLTEEANK